jgi:metabolite-proton symporter
MSTAAEAGPPPDPRAQLRRAIVASTIGTTIEWYDFFLYGVATPLVFAKLYFPGSDPAVGMLKSFAIYAVGFAARPIGAAIFGQFGDKIGRKSTLIATLLLMGLATFAVAFVPGYDQIGIWGAVILTVLRFVQGVGVGGEWGGSVLMSMEWAQTDRHRGFIASWPQFGVPAGLFLANLTILGFSRLSGDGFLTWGWRVPFMLSIVLVAIGLWIRLGILETPVFARLVAERRTAAAPMREAIRRHPREIVLAALLRMVEQAPFYLFTTFVFDYGREVLDMPRDFLLTAVMAGACTSFVALPYFGHLSDRIGRRRMYLIGAATIGVYGFVYFTLFDTGSKPLIFAAIVLSMIPHAMVYGPQAALIAELFPGRLRYSGASIGYQLASLIAGGPAPLVATALLTATRSGYAIAAYILVCALVSLVAASLVKDYTNRDIAAAHGEARPS